MISIRYPKKAAATWDAYAVRRAKFAEPAGHGRRMTAVERAHAVAL